MIAHQGGTGAARSLIALAAAIALLAPGDLRAQDLRTIDLARQLRDSLPLTVVVDHEVGNVVVHGTREPLLYHVQLAYHPSRTEPTYRFDSTARVLHVGLTKARSAEGAAEPELRLDLSRAVPVDLRLQMGAAGADLDLGGMRLTRLAVASGASDAVVHFDEPNAIPMQLLELDVGAASLRARGLGNARAREMRVNVGIGAVELDFGGAWTGDLNLDLQVSLGKAHLRVPEDVGVRVDVRRFLATFDRPDFVRRGDYYYSRNWDTATRKLLVRSRTILGQLEVSRGAD